MTSLKLTVLSLSDHQKKNNIFHNFLGHGYLLYHNMCELNFITSYNAYQMIYRKKHPNIYVFIYNDSQAKPNIEQAIN